MTGVKELLTRIALHKGAVIMFPPASVNHDGLTFSINGGDIIGISALEQVQCADDAARLNLALVKLSEAGLAIGDSSP